LRLLTRLLSGDVNERYLLAHAALLNILRDDPDLVRFPKTIKDLRAALGAVV
jgi:hypothetical protein